MDNLTFFLLFSFNIFLACIPIEKLTTYISNVCGSTTVPFLQFTLPGFLYYMYLQQYGRTKDQEYYKLKKAKAYIHRIIFGKSFSVLFIFLGLIQIFIFVTIIIYGLVV